MGQTCDQGRWPHSPVGEGLQQDSLPSARASGRPGPPAGSEAPCDCSLRLTIFPLAKFVRHRDKMKIPIY